MNKYAKIMLAVNRIPPPKKSTGALFYLVNELHKISFGPMTATQANKFFEDKSDQFIPKPQ